jgi:hypothetical protein
VGSALREEKSVAKGVQLVIASKQSGQTEGALPSDGQKNPPVLR